MRFAATLSRLLGPSLLILASNAFAQGRLDRYALILDDPPVAVASAAANAERQLTPEPLRRRIEAAQTSLRLAVEDKGLTVLGATQTVLNAVYVAAPGLKPADLLKLPGVVRVERMEPLRRHMNRALDLVAAREAWSDVGGVTNAGAGVRIGIIDTGIDQDHPAFQDASLTPPAGYPRCAPADCAYTNRKIIAARSYVQSLVLADQPQYSRPDDLSPRDRVGHGTATAMVAAGVETQGPSATVSGVAPKAFLGNYKVFGSPGVNDVTFDDTILQALDDAIDDGMHIVVMSIGRPAEWGPNDRGSTCNLSGSEPCDVRAAAVEAAVAAGVTVVVSAGNDGDLAYRFPALNSLHTPGTAPSAITVGASTNSHIFFSSLRPTGADVPSNVQRIPLLLGDGPQPGGPLTAPMRDVATTEPNGRACEPLGSGTLTGAIAILDRGDCSFLTKVNNAQKAGAVAVVVVQTEGSDFIFPMTGLGETGLPAGMIGSTNGKDLRAFLQANRDRSGTLDPKLDEYNAEADTVAYFSSRGPAIGEGHIKPELVAVGTDVYMATQVYDPNGDMWDPSRFTAQQGTSFSTPMVAGAAALVKQAHPGFSPALIKSAVVNTATSPVADFDESNRRIEAGVTAVGAGKLHVARAVSANVTAEPSVLSFGPLASGSLPSLPLRIRNTGNSSLNLTLRVQPADSRLELSRTSFGLGAGSSEQITVRVRELPPAGSYEGAVVVEGGAVPLRIPYLYLRGDSAPFNALPLRGFDFRGNVSEDVKLVVKVIDRFGVPVRNTQVRFSRPRSTDAVTGATDPLGIVEATLRLTANPGEQEFLAEVLSSPDLRLRFPGIARLRPSILSGGVVNAASGQTGEGLAPGSYISIFGRNLSDATKVFSTPYLPLSLAGVSVSFDEPSRGISVPGRLTYVSEGQINVQLPWELAGLNAVAMKVSIGPLTESALFTVPLKNHSPALFEIADPGGSGRQVVAALDETNQVLSSTNPARRGRVAQLYANGLGPVDNTVPSGEATLPDRLSRTLQQPEVTIGGAAAPVQFSGLAPSYVGLYQVNVTVPQSLQPGMHEVVVSIGGVRSKPVLLYVN